MTMKAGANASKKGGRGETEIEAMGAFGGRRRCQGPPPPPPPPPPPRPRHASFRPASAAAPRGADGQGGGRAGAWRGRETEGGALGAVCRAATASIVCLWEGGEEQQTQ